MGPQVCSEAYSGPIEVLVQLVTRHDVDIHELSITRIVQDIVRTVQTPERLDLDTATDLLLYGSILIELKVRRLLPGDKPLDIDDEELQPWDERELFLARLARYRTFQSAAEAIAAMIDTAALSKARRTGLDDRYAHLQPNHLAGVTPEELRQACRNAGPPQPTKLDRSHVTPIRLTVTDTLERLTANLAHLHHATLAELCIDQADKMEHIVTFLALLELYKRGTIDLTREPNTDRLTAIWITTNKSDQGQKQPIDEYQG